MYSFTTEDIAYLRSPAGTSALTALSARPLTDRLADVKAAKQLAGPQFAAALETAVLRKRAAAKLTDPTNWLLCDTALQQATATPVAQHRATRLRNRNVHDITCGIGADLIELTAVANICIGSDIDPIRLAMAANNCPNTPLLQADALHPVTRNTAIVADPARRDNTGRRHWHPADLAPPLNDLVDAYSGRDLAIKCAPGLDFEAVPWANEIELISLDGTVREACLWTGSLATQGIHRRATVIRHNQPQWTITDADPDDCPTRPPGRWLIDPDGAVIRAGLVRQYATRHHLAQLDPRIAYLTGDDRPPAVRAFEILDRIHYTEKALRAALRSFDVGALEIMVRGLDVTPDVLRPRLKLTGTQPATAVLTRIGNTPTAFICQAQPALPSGT